MRLLCLANGIGLERPRVMLKPALRRNCTIRDTFSGIAPANFHLGFGPVACTAGCFETNLEKQHYNFCKEVTEGRSLYVTRSPCYEFREIPVAFLVYG